ncbi:MAG: hypothetical protein Kow0088_11460 [Anaerolineales bacterium]
MQSICIVTDTTAQCPSYSNGWEEFVKVLPPSLIDQNLRASPSRSAGAASESPATSPDCETHHRKEHDTLKTILTNLASEYQQVLFLLPTKTLFPTFNVITQTLNQMNLPSVFNIIDSHSLGYGLGWLIQTCITYLKQKNNSSEFMRFLHNRIPKIYTLIYLPSLAPLSNSRILDADQALIGDILGIRPLLILENDQVVPYQKIRSYKNMLECMVEYTQEFRHIEYIGIHYGLSVGSSERKNLQNRLQSLVAHNPIDVQVMTPYMHQVLGDQSISMILVEGEIRHEI